MTGENNIKNDWRYQEQERYLNKLTFSKTNYNPSENNDHDHCEFCSEKFSNNIPGSLKVGWTDKMSYHWICISCFEDFADKLNLKRK